VAGWSHSEVWRTSNGGSLPRLAPPAAGTLLFAMPALIIEAGRTERHYWRDLWRYRELFFFLAWRDILVRYKQTVIGVVWALIRPVATIVVLTAVFSKIAGLPSAGAAPYGLMVFAGMLPWNFFATSLSESSGSLVANSSLISKVYFPRLIVPACSVITSFIDFLITFALMAGAMAWKGFWPDWHIVALPFFVVLAFAAALGCGLWLCALTVQFRDFRFIVPFVVQYGVYVSPVGLTNEVILAKLARWPLATHLYSLNPMVGAIDGFRWSLLRAPDPLSPLEIGRSVLVTTLLCLSGIWYFRRTEKGFADVI
jgi:homopolymeric O-antigen transport system permease protein